jgi:hypothetical protein
MDGGIKKAADDGWASALEFGIYSIVPTTLYGQAVFHQKL